MSPPSRPPGGAHADRLFRAVVENSSDAIALVDAKGVIRFASQSSARVLGYSLVERLGRRAFELPSAGARAASHTTSQRACRKAPASRAVDRLRHRQGGRGDRHVPDRAE